MSVLIRGMEMPTSCPCELLGIGYDLHCSFADGVPARVKEYYECCQNGTRPSWCPLVPVPPHGRLIGAEALRKQMYHEAFETDSDMQKWDSGCWIRYKMFENALESAPTIIDAEESE